MVRESLSCHNGTAIFRTSPYREYQNIFASRRQRKTECLRLWIVMPGPYLTSSEVFCAIALWYSDRSFKCISRSQYRGNTTGGPSQLTPDVITPAWLSSELDLLLTRMGVLRCHWHLDIRVSPCILVVLRMQAHNAINRGSLPYATAPHDRSVHVLHSCSREASSSQCIP